MKTDADTEMEAETDGPGNGGLATELKKHFSIFKWQVGPHGVFIRSKSCKDVDGQSRFSFGTLCPECHLAANDRTLVECASRAALLFDLVELLNASLYFSKDELDSIKKEIREDADYCIKPAFRMELHTLMGMSVCELGSTLRKKCHRNDVCFDNNPEWMTYKKNRIYTLLNAAEGDSNPKRALCRSMALCVAEHLANGTVTETNLQLGATIASGGLDGAPVVEGIVMAAIQKLEFQHRQGREEPSMRGRHRGLTNIQMSRLQDAISALRGTSPKELIKSLGLGTTAFKPVGEAADVFPFCSLDDPDKLQNNVEVVVRAMLQSTEFAVPIVITFDETYLWKRPDIINLQGEIVFVGGAWPESSMIKKENRTSVLSYEPAVFMLDFLLKRADNYDTVSVCCLPVAKNGHTGWLVMCHIKAVLGAALKDSAVGTICLAYDNGPNFRLVNNVLLGKPLTKIQTKAFQEDPFWNSCRLINIPGSKWPFGALAVPRITQGGRIWQIVFGGNDPPHCLKIMACQLRKSCRTIMFGELAVDCASCLAHGMPPSFFRGNDRQSDREASLLFMFCLPPKGTSLTFSGCGLLLYAFVTSAALTPWFDPNLTLEGRQLLSAFAFYFFHIAREYVNQEAVKHNWPGKLRSQSFLAPASFEAITSCCSHMVSRSFWWNREVEGQTPREAFGNRDSGRFVPSEQMECAAEHHFGRLRARFSNHQLSAKDYITATAALAKISMRKFQQRKYATESQEHEINATDQGQWEKTDKKALRHAAQAFKHCVARMSKTRLDELVQSTLAKGPQCSEVPESASAEGDEEDGDSGDEDCSDEEEEDAIAMEEGSRPPSVAELVQHTAEAEIVSSEAQAEVAEEMAEEMAENPSLTEKTVSVGSIKIWEVAFKHFEKDDFNFRSFAEACRPALEHARKMENFVKTIYTGDINKRGSNDYNEASHTLAMERAVTMDNTQASRTSRQALWMSTSQSIVTKVRKILVQKYHVPEGGLSVPTAYRSWAVPTTLAKDAEASGGKMQRDSDDGRGRFPQVLMLESAAIKHYTFVDKTLVVAVLNVWCGAAWRRSETAPDKVVRQTKIHHLAATEIPVAHARFLRVAMLSQKDVGGLFQATETDQVFNIDPLAVICELQVCDFKPTACKRSTGCSLRLTDSAQTAVNKCMSAPWVRDEASALNPIIHDRIFEASNKEAAQPQLRDLTDLLFRKTVPGRSSIVEAVNRAAAQHERCKKTVRDDQGVVKMSAVKKAAGCEAASLTFDYLANKSPSYFEIIFKDQTAAAYGIHVFKVLEDATKDFAKFGVLLKNIYEACPLVTIGLPMSRRRVLEC